MTTEPFLIDEIPRPAAARDCPDGAEALEATGVPYASEMGASSGATANTSRPSTWVRDIGGGRLEHGPGRFRMGAVYRFPGSVATSAETDHLRRCGVRVLIDLRAHDEQRDALAQWAGELAIPYRHVPIIVGRTSDFKEALHRSGRSPSELARIVTSLYLGVVDEHGDDLASAVRNLVGHLPAAFGCAAGKDRTGILAALLQRLVGVTRDDVVAHYAATPPPPQALRDVADEWNEKVRGPYLEGMSLLSILEAKPTTITAALDHIETNHGGAESYFRSAGLTAEDVRWLRRELTDPGAG